MDNGVGTCSFRRTGYVTYQCSTPGVEPRRHSCLPWVLKFVGVLLMLYIAHLMQTILMTPLLVNMSECCGLVSLICIVCSLPLLCMSTVPMAPSSVTVVPTRDPKLWTVQWTVADPYVNATQFNVTVCAKGQLCQEFVAAGASVRSIFPRSYFWL